MSTDHSELFDPSRSADFASILETLRRDDPIFYFDREEFSSWVITRHEHVVKLLRDKRLGVPSVLTRIAHFTDEQKKELEPMQEFVRNNLGRTRERRLALRQASKALLRPTAVEKLRSRTREVMASLLAEVEVEVDAPVDLISAFAYPMPAIMMAEVLGAPSSDRHRFIDWSNALIEYHRAYEFEPMLEAQSGVVEMLDYCAQKIEERRRSGCKGDDMIGAFARVLDAGRFEMGELASSCATFLMAGHENTTHLIGNVFRCLFAHPDQLAEIKREPSLIPRAIYETLRYNGVVPFLTREVEEPFEFEGRQFEKGHLISLSLFSANRDDSVFDAPDVFDIHNERARQALGFGHGANQCRGSHLAMVETEELIGFLFERFPDMTPVEGRMETWNRPMLRRYITRLEVRLRASL